MTDSITIRYCAGPRWECPIDGLQWCEWCNPECRECGTPRPVNAEEGRK